MKTFSKSLVSVLASVSLLTLSSCIDETTQNSLDRKRDLERETSQALTRDYEQVAGHYVTETSVDTSPYLMTADFTTILIQKDGALLPVPSIAGSLEMQNKTPTTGTNDNSPGYGFVISGGVYDPNLALLTFKVSSPAGDVASINVNCKVSLNQGTEQKTILNCSWNPSLPGQRFNFILLRK